MLKAKKTISLDAIDKSLAKQKQAHARSNDFPILLRGDKRSAGIAAHYGFRPIESPLISRDDLYKTRTLFDLVPLKEEEIRNADCAVRAEEKVALTRYYLENNMQSWPQPVLFYYEGPVNYEGSRRRLSNRNYYHLDIIGTTKSIAEATLLKTAFEILKEKGYGELAVYVNTIGDKDSMARFSRELGLYYRKHLDTVHVQCRTVFKRDVYEMLECNHEKCVEIRAGIPDPISYLTEPSRRHFREVLEYLESLSIPYETKKDLIHNKKFQCQTIFEIRQGEAGNILARGMRYNEVGRKMGIKRDVGCVGITISLAETSVPKKIFLKKMVSPKVYFIQLGFDAKLKSLEVIDLLRAEKIPLAQSIAKDKMIGQLQTAESLKIPYAIIMGQKEAREGSVIFRDLNTHSQETIMIADLIRYLRKLR